jgi:hypothetical protein
MTLCEEHLRKMYPRVDWRLVRESKVAGRATSTLSFPSSSEKESDAVSSEDELEDHLRTLSMPSGESLLPITKHSALNEGSCEVLGSSDAVTEGHAAGMYFVCNICLEPHSNSLMQEIDGCGHRYEESCVWRVRQGKYGRRYNCTFCQEWLRTVVAQ